MEFKTITGGIDVVEKRFRKAKKQGENVFLKIDNPHVTQESVLSKLFGVLNDPKYSGGSEGMLAAYFSHTGKIYFWDIEHIKKARPG